MIDLMNIYRRSESLSRHENIDDKSVAKKRQTPKEEKKATKKISNQWILWGEFSPMLMHHTL